MYFYKFRVYFDDVEDFVRDIEILSHDTFASFHDILYSSIGLKGNELASFFICDSKWNKQKEITLIDMGDDRVVETPEYAENDDYSTDPNMPKSVMNDSVLKNFITDPHQQIIYEYDFLKPKVFYIELLKINPKQNGVEYPRCTYKVKEMPPEVASVNLPNPEDDFMDDLDDGGDEFQDGYNEEDAFDLGSIEDIGNDF
ncbi:plasmid pRiA4b ORF-3 family protein [Bacteroidales bacterium OttesenSCG-928-B11]|nr:plasmid pRiA4b ORF-3 family protein [Bacteroidales bacterium OttesenSCG-928-E04]MDL2308706.1 plasmid pRiA4b ORF-3 family protein [Bacteroidales bacterium OttesenSCG-928-C03]MDL2311939.1 plasmid pRiA4b ORF-3 family protein [Bacteroidales bacterium OttesenSCG-928-B11]